MLFLAIQDYFKLKGKLTIEMRAIRNWYFANYPDRLIKEKQRLAHEFSYMAAWSRVEQKKELRKQISELSVSDAFHEPTRLNIGK